MHALLTEKPGPHARLDDKEMPLPQLGREEVLIRVHAAGVNRADLFQREGSYPLPEGASPVLGLEVAGVVEKVGEDVAWPAVGERVAALVDGGGYAEFAVADEGLCFPMPDNLSFLHAAALPEALMTGWMALMDKGRLKMGESVLIYGGASGIGSTLIQMVQSLGARVFATATTEEKAALVAELGAETILLKDVDLVKEIKARTEGKGVDVILDMVGAERTADNFAMAAVGGRIVTIALLGGGTVGEGVQVPLSRLLMKRLSWSGAMLRPMPLEKKRRYACEIRENVWPAVESQAIRPVIDSVFPLAEADKALDKMRDFSNKGKIVLEVEEKTG